jgi:hypothetical protein
MKNLQPQLWHHLGPPQVTVLTVVAVLDTVVLGALGYAIASARSELVLLVAPTYSALFMVLACTLGAYARRGLVSWPLLSGILLVGPVGAAVALRRFGPRS